MIIKIQNNEFNILNIVKSTVDSNVDGKAFKITMIEELDNENIIEHYFYFDNALQLADFNKEIGNQLLKGALKKLDKTNKKA